MLKILSPVLAVATAATFATSARAQSPEAAPSPYSAKPAIPESAFSHHVMALFGISFLFLYGLLANAFRLTFPVNEVFHRYDCHLTALSLVRQDRLDAKQFKRFYPNYIPPHPKRVYSYRLQ